LHAPRILAAHLYSCLRIFSGIRRAEALPSKYFSPPQIPSIIENHNRSRATEGFRYPSIFFCLSSGNQASCWLTLFDLSIVALGAANRLSSSVCVIDTGVGFPSLWMRMSIEAREIHNPQLVCLRCSGRESCGSPFFPSQTSSTNGKHGGQEVTSSSSISFLPLSSIEGMRSPCRAGEESLGVVGMKDYRQVVVGHGWLTRSRLWLVSLHLLYLRNFLPNGVKGA